jgi:hypothetical protein
MAAADALLPQLRQLTGLASLTEAELNTGGWLTKQRVFLGLFAELPSGEQTVSELVRLQNERTRARASEQTAKVLPHVSRLGEDTYREAFLAVVASALEELQAGRSLTSAARLGKDNMACKAAYSFLAARIAAQSRRGSHSSSSSSIAPSRRLSLGSKRASVDNNASNLSDRPQWVTTDVQPASESLQQKQPRRRSSDAQLKERAEWQDVHTPATAGSPREAPVAAAASPRPLTAAAAAVAAVVAAAPNARSRRTAGHQPAVSDSADAGFDVRGSDTPFSGAKSSKHVPVTVSSGSAAALQEENNLLKEQLSTLQCAYGALTALPAAGSAEAAEVQSMRHTAMLMSQISQLRRQVALQGTALEASTTVAAETGRVLDHLDHTFSNVVELAGADAVADVLNSRASDSDAAAAAGVQHSGSSVSGSSSTKAATVASASRAPQWKQVLTEVKRLNRDLVWADRAAARAVHSPLHTGVASEEFKPRKPSQLCAATASTTATVARGSDKALQRAALLHVDAAAVGKLELELAAAVQSMATLHSSVGAAHEHDAMRHGAQLTADTHKLRLQLQRLLWRVSALGTVIEPAVDKLQSVTWNYSLDAYDDGNTCASDDDAQLQSLAASIRVRSSDDSDALAALLHRVRADKQAAHAVAAAATAQADNLQRANTATAAAVHSLASGLKRAWQAYTKQVQAGLAQPLTAVLEAYEEVESCQQIAALKRGASGNQIAYLLSVLAEHQNDLTAAAQGSGWLYVDVGETLSALWADYEAAVHSSSSTSSSSNV